MSGSSLADVRKMREDRVDDCQSRILHQHDRRHTEAVRRAAVDVAHLRGCQDLHWLMSGKCARIASMTARAAFSISTIDGTPKLSVVRRSMLLICADVRIFIG